MKKFERIVGIFDILWGIGYFVYLKYFSVSALSLSSIESLTKYSVEEKNAMAQFINSIINSSFLSVFLLLLISLLVIRAMNNRHAFTFGTIVSLVTIISGIYGIDASSFVSSLLGGTFIILESFNVFGKNKIEEEGETLDLF